VYAGSSSTVRHVKQARWTWQACRYAHACTTSLTNCASNCMKANACVLCNRLSPTRTLWAGHCRIVHNMVLPADVSVRVALCSADGVLTKRLLAPPPPPAIAAPAASPLTLTPPLAWMVRPGCCRNGYCQAEGVANLDLVAPTGCLISMGWPRLAGGTGGSARFVAICPGSWPHGTTVAATRGPLPKQPQQLQWSKELGYRVRR